MKIGFWQLLEDASTSTNILCLCTGCNLITKPINKWNLLKQKTKSCGCQSVDSMKRTNILKYGVEFTQQDPTTKEKGRITLLEKYGVENYANSPERNKQIEQTNLEKRKVTHHSKTQEFKEKMSKLKTKKPKIGKAAYGRQQYGKK